MPGKIEIEKLDIRNIIEIQKLVKSVKDKKTLLLLEEIIKITNKYLEEKYV